MQEYNKIETVLTTFIKDSLDESSVKDFNNFITELDSYNLNLMLDKESVFEKLEKYLLEDNILEIFSKLKILFILNGYTFKDLSFVIKTGIYLESSKTKTKIKQTQDVDDIHTLILIIKVYIKVLLKSIIIYKTNKDK